MKLDILAIAVHPDDAELSCSGTLIKHIKAGKTAGIVDLTRGELGTRGSGELRLKESAVAAKIMGLSARENLGMADGFFEYNKSNQIAIIQMIRKYRPDIVENHKNIGDRNKFFIISKTDISNLILL